MKKTTQKDKKALKNFRLSNYRDRNKKSNNGNNIRSNLYNCYGQSTQEYVFDVKSH